MSKNIGIAFGSGQAICVPNLVVFAILALAIIGAWSLKKKYY